MTRDEPETTGTADGGAGRGAHVVSSGGDVPSSRPGRDDGWLHTWVASPRPAEPHEMPPTPFIRDGSVLVATTLRQTVCVSIGGQALRLRFSNAFGDMALPITAVSVALPRGGRAGVAAIEPGSARMVTFCGRSSIVVPVGAQVVSDPLDLDVPPRANLTVTVYLADGQPTSAITAHPGSRTTSFLATGNHVLADDLPDATAVDHWYFLSGLEVPAPSGAAAVLLGDSLTDGRGSTTNANNRWPDRLLVRLRDHPPTRGIAVLNQGSGGNRVLNDGLGPSVLARLDRDVLAISGVRWLVVFAGINDIGTAAASSTAQQQVVDELIAAYQQIMLRAHSHGIRVYGATLLPFGGHADYDDQSGHREAARQAVNQWIRTSGRFDGVIDFDRTVRDPAEPRRLLPAYDVDDHLHLNPAGYQALADAVPVTLFE